MRNRFVGYLFGEAGMPNPRRSRRWGEVLPANSHRLVSKESATESTRRVGGAATGMRQARLPIWTGSDEVGAKQTIGAGSAAGGRTSR